MGDCADRSEQPRRLPSEEKERVFGDFGADAFRTALVRACKAAGIPAFSPHDLRHRRASLWHLGGVPAAQAAAWLGHSAVEHVRTYAHVVLDRREVDYAMLMRARAVAHPWHTAAEKAPISSMV